MQQVGMCTGHMTPGGWATWGPVRHLRVDSQHWRHFVAVAEQCKAPAARQRCSKMQRQRPGFLVIAGTLRAHTRVVPMACLEG